MRRRAFLLVASLAAWVVGSALGSVGTPRAAQAAPYFELGKVRAGFTPTLDQSQPIFILFIGSDAREQHGTPVEKGLGDSIHIVGINPAKDKVSILGFPRDSYVSIPGHGSMKINNGLALGGPELMVETMEELTGIRIDYYALTGFDGIEAMIDGIGGLVVDVPYPMSDPFSRTDFEAGPQRLDGRGVLAFSRDRHSLNSGDFGRSENQGRVFVSALAQFRKEFTKDPSRMLTWIGAGMRNVATDVPLDEIMTLAFAVSSIDPDDVQNMVVPGGTATVNGQSIVTISSTAEAIYRDMEGDGLVKPKNVPPSPETPGA